MENTNNSNSTKPVAGGSTGPSNNSAGSSSNPQFIGMPTHSILSAQADLNTNSVSKPSTFNPTPTPAPVTVPKPEVRAEPVKSAYQGMPEPQVFSVPRANPAPAPASNLSSNPASYTMPKSAIAPTPVFTQASSASSASTAPSNQKHEVVFDDSTSEVTEAKHANGHVWAIIVSSIVVILLLGGGFYYWYYNMNGKDMLADTTDMGAEVPTNTTTANPPAPTSQFPAGVVNNPVKTQHVAPKPVDPGAFGGPAVDEPAGFDSAEKEKITAYISQNINKLSLVKSSEAYAVTDIQFDGPNRAIVSYENSQYNISAIANVYIDMTGNVKVSGFSILEK